MKTKQKIKKQLAGYYFGKEAKDYDERRIRDVRAKDVFDRELEIVKKFLKNSEKGKLLDVACGTGRVFPTYGNREIYGIDISKEMLNQAKKRDPKAKLKISDAENIPYPNSTFSVTITSRFICHTPNYKKVIKEMARVTKKGGSIIIDFPNKHSLTFIPTLIRLLLKKLRYFNLFSFSQIKEIAQENNLQIKEIEGKTVIPPRTLPKIFHNQMKKLNKILTRKFPYFSNPLYIRFIKK